STGRLPLLGYVAPWNADGLPLLNAWYSACVTSYLPIQNWLLMVTVCTGVARLIDASPIENEPGAIGTMLPLGPTVRVRSLSARYRLAEATPRSSDCRSQE